MKFRCERDALAEALSTAGRAATGRTGALPVLSGLRLELVGDKLTIKGEIMSETDPQTANYLRRERRVGPFTRTVTIPRPVKAEEAGASFKDGILTIMLPKVEEAGPKVINVKPVDS